MAKTNLEKYALKVAKDFRDNGSMDNYHYTEVALIIEQLVVNSTFNTAIKPEKIKVEIK